MAQSHISLKRIGVTKTNGQIVGVTAGAAFIVVFCVVASISLFSQLMYQNKVISVKKKAVAQLEDNIGARDSLVTSYKAFVATPQNVLGGNPAGNGDHDGSNAKIVLDALPSSYDFPALTSSLEKLATSQGVTIKDITGTDDAVAQTTGGDGAAQPIPVPFTMSVAGNYNAIQNTVVAMGRSIRPIQIQKLEITGDQNDFSVTVDAQTFYQPAKGLNIIKKTVQ